MAKPEDRFWKNVDRGTGCWLWIGDRDGKGYGRFQANNRRRGAHRFSWEFANGPIPEGQCVLHHCDTPLCVRPDHLFLGTKLDNSLDMSRKQRGGRPTKLPDESAREVLARRIAGEAGSSLAREFGISAQQICNIFKGRSRTRAQAI